jgi:hypothetical protein
MFLFLFLFISNYFFFLLRNIYICSMLPGRILYIWIDIVSTVFIFLVPFFAPPSGQSLQIEAPEQTESQNALLIWQDDSPATLVPSTLSSVSPPYPLSALSPVPSLKVLKTLESVSPSSSWLIIESSVLKSTPVISPSLMIPPKDDDYFNTGKSCNIYVYLCTRFNDKHYYSFFKKKNV